MIKQKPGEDFSSEKVEAVISMLDNGETKKSCCNFLGMNYSTTRLAKIIEEHNDKQELQENLRKSLRNKPLDKQDIIYICQEYLNGEALVVISDNIYRSTNVVKNVLRKYSIPLRNASNNYFNPVYIDSDEVINYVSGDLVFSAKYNTLAEIVKEIKPDIYRIIVFGTNQQYALQPEYELADLRKVQKDLGVTGVWEKDTRQRAWASVVEGMKKAKKKK